MQICRYARGKFDRDTPFADEANPVCLNSTDCAIENIPPGSDRDVMPRNPLDLPLLRENWIDTAVVQNGGIVPPVSFW